MKICYLIDGLRSGGKERQLYELIKGLIALKGISVSNIIIVSMFPNGIFNERFEKLGIDIYYYQIINVSNKLSKVAVATEIFLFRFSTLPDPEWDNPQSVRVHDK